MITEAEIKTIVYKYVKSSDLATAVNGIVTKRKRPTNSTKEDIVISVLTSDCGEIQQFFVNVNVYVPYNSTNKEEDSARVQELSVVAMNVFERQNLNGIKLNIDTQHIEDLPEIGYSVINNKLLVKQANS